MYVSRLPQGLLKSVFFSNSYMFANIFLCNLYNLVNKYIALYTCKALRNILCYSNICFLVFVLFVFCFVFVVVVVLLCFVYLLYHYLLGLFVFFFPRARVAQ
jgi:hypothetical protein